MVPLGICFVLSALFQLSASDFTDHDGRYIYYPMAIAAHSSNPSKCLNTVNANNSYTIQNIIPYRVDCDILGWHIIALDCLAYMAYWPEKTAYIIAFRGSLDIQVLEEENATLTFDPVPMAGVGKVNYYFYHAFQRLWTNMSRDVTNVANGNANIYIVGHSLGGSLASVLAAYLASALNVASNRLTLVTFGQPRTGDTDFASFITSHVDTRYRVVNDKDQVPHSILKGWENYEHFGEEIWYHNDMAVGDSPIICAGGESSNCSDSLGLYWELSDHVYYYNILMTTYQYYGCTYPPAVQCPSNWIQTDVSPAKCIAVPPYPLSWTDALEYCRNNISHPLGSKADLVSIHNAFRNTEINAKAKQAIDLYPYFALGLYNPTGQWKWVDTTTVDYTNWKSDINSSAGVQKCGAMKRDDATWIYGDCENKLISICELTFQQ